jgi:uncharacterized protein (TIGR03435 family)
LVMPVLMAHAQGVTDAPSFEVASIKVRTGPAGLPPPSSPDRYTQINASLRDLVLDAYGLQRYEVVGGPAWVAGSVRFDVAAKAPLVPTREQMRLMEQRLLAERFALRAHKETREMQTYVLRLARADGRLGGQLIRTPVDCDAIRADRTLDTSPAPSPAGGQPVCTSISMAIPSAGGGITLRHRASGVTVGDLAAWLSPYVGRTIVDRTGLAGDFDLDLAFSPGALAAAAPADEAASIFTALQEQLGLKLDSASGPVDVLVIDGAEMPTPD